MKDFTVVGVYYNSHEVVVDHVRAPDATRAAKAFFDADAARPGACGIAAIFPGHLHCEASPSAPDLIDILDLSS